MIRIALCCIVLSAVTCAQLNTSFSLKKNFVYNVYKYNTAIRLNIDNNTEQILDFEEETDINLLYPTRVHILTETVVTPEHPVFISAAQQKGISSWELPLVVQTNQHSILLHSMARTLCPHDAGNDIKVKKGPSIHLSTSNPQNVTIDIELTRVTDFYVEVNKELSLNVTPSTPVYYFFSFEQNPWNVTKDVARLQGLPTFNYTIPKSVILIVESDDVLCATVAIQNNSCPVFDNEKDILYEGYHLTMMDKGGITLTQSMFPNGFYVVFIVKESDEECTGVSETENPHNILRDKQFRFRIMATISYSEYVTGALVTLALVGVAVLLVLVVQLPLRCKWTEEVVVIEEDPAPSTSATAVRDDAPLMDDQVVEAPLPSQHILNVAKLSQAPPDTLARRSERYFWSALTLAVVYALPVVQLLYTYQRMVFQTGNQDLCYYNFLCAHPLGGLSDFNHVFSNVGYVLLGGVFMVQVAVRQRRARAQPADRGLPQHYGLLYAMGLSLAMEGVLSACYHLCPNKMNFQFDSSFMYVIAVLVMLKLYQNRHSDLMPSAHSAFILIAVIMGIGLFGILFPSVYFSILFTALYLGSCLLLTLKIYFAGEFKMEAGTVRRAVQRMSQRGVRSLVPRHTARAVLLAIANVLNWSFAIYTLWSHNKDFARQLLAILMGNAVLYTLCYVVMKLCARERLDARAAAYCACANLAWFAATWQFLSSNTRWAGTPAQSRSLNHVCTYLGVFDSHDLWHVLSAAALFLSFNMLLVTDDPLRASRRSDIPTF